MEEELFVPSDHRIITIAPALSCYACERMTDQAELEPNGSCWQLVPRCWEHSYTDAAGPQEELESVKRYIVGYYDNTGIVETISSCNPFDAPGYVPRPREWFEFDDVAWKVCYIGRDLQPITLYIVMHMNWLEFEMYPLERRKR